MGEDQDGLAEGSVANVAKAIGLLRILMKLTGVAEGRVLPARSTVWVSDKLMVQGRLPKTLITRFIIDNKLVYQQQASSMTTGKINVQQARSTTTG